MRAGYVLANLTAVWYGCRMEAEIIEPEPGLRLIFVPASDDLPQEFQRELSEFAEALRGRGIQVSVRSSAFDAVHGVGGLSGEFIFAITTLGFLAKRLEGPLRTFLKRERKARVEFMEGGKLKAVEAEGADQVVRIVRAAAEYHKSISNE